jgi:hypothetical protein
VKHGGGALLVTLIYLEFKEHNQHGYHSILLLYTIPSVLDLVGQSFVFQQDNDPIHLQAVEGLLEHGE